MHEFLTGKQKKSADIFSGVMQLMLQTSFPPSAQRAVFDLRQHYSVKIHAVCK